MMNWLTERLLASGLLFDSFQSGTGAHACVVKAVSSLLPSSSSLRVLDLGCGTGSALKFLRPAAYVGVDVNAGYLRRARRRAARFGVSASFYLRDGSRGSFLPDGLETFDLVLALGVLHHLDDGVASRLLEEARGVLSPGGFLLTLDGFFSPGNVSVVPDWLARHDRGRFVREVGEYVGLAEGVFERVESRVSLFSFSFGGRFCVPVYRFLVLKCSV